MSAPEPQATQSPAPSTSVTADTASESPPTTTSLEHKQSDLDHGKLDPGKLDPGKLDADIIMPVTDTDIGCGDGMTLSNGHLCPNENLTNGVSTDQSSHGSQGSQSPPVQSFMDVAVENQNGTQKSPSFLSANADPDNNCVAGAMSSPSTSPNCYSPNRNNSVSPHSGGSSHSGGCGGPGGSPPHGGQHVVHVHVNPGETFSVRVGDQIQHIQGRPRPTSILGLISGSLFRISIQVCFI